MALPRIIPCLLVDGKQLVKTQRFGDPRYVGDPVNAVRIFNDKEVDELIVLDIDAPRSGREPAVELVRTLASEAFMPVCYGGGVTTTGHLQRLLEAGIEKVAITTAAIEHPEVISEGASTFGSQSIVVGIDVRDGRVHVRAGAVDTGLDPVEHALRVRDLGAGEILLTSVDREGTRTGYDLDLVERVAAAVDLPVVAHGGAGSIDDLRAALGHGASAAAAGSMFVFHGRRQAVLINYLRPAERDSL